MYLLKKLYKYKYKYKLFNVTEIKHDENSDKHFVIAF